MARIYQSPLRVYLVIGALAIWGILSGFDLSISLFPLSERAVINVRVPFWQFSGQQFLKNYGYVIETRLGTLAIEGKSPEKISAAYEDSEVTYRVTYPWGVSSRTAYKEVQGLVSGLSGSWPKDIRDAYEVYQNSQENGFFAMSFYSSKRSLDDLYKELNPILKKKYSTVTEAENLTLYNPHAKQLFVELMPDKMADFQLTPQDIQRVFLSSAASLNGGVIESGRRSLVISVPAMATNLEELKHLVITTKKNGHIHLKEIANIELKEGGGGQSSFRTSGVPSLILFANPKPGANIKQMSDKIVEMIGLLKDQIPPDVESQVLVNPSDFINASIRSVIQEVGLAALLAVLVLFVFVGNIQNVITAAVEIPLSLVLAFILMKQFGMNLNLISLGGLALSAGMNVDASVVVMENIFRHFHLHHANSKSPLTQSLKFQIVKTAVEEVRMPIIASTIASLVVFLPLVLTHGLAEAILGDLAKAVIFSHAFSAIVALILVPTVRLQLLKRAKNDTHSPIEKYLVRWEKSYVALLRRLIESPRAQIVGLLSVALSLILLVGLVLPRISKELVGNPDTDWLVLSVNAPTSSSPQQLESVVDETERHLQQKVGKLYKYTFSQLHGTHHASIMMRLEDKSKIKALSQTLEAEFESTPTLSFNIDQWNPSELPIPKFPDFRISISGASPQVRNRWAEDIKTELLEKQIFQQVRTLPESSSGEGIVLRPYQNSQNFSLDASIADLVTWTRIATVGANLGYITLGGETYTANLRTTSGIVSNIEDVKAFPIGVNNRVVPLSAYADVHYGGIEPKIFRLNQAEQNVIEGQVGVNTKATNQEVRAYSIAEKIIAQSKGEIAMEKNDAHEELTQSLSQLERAIGLSVLLIFITMILLFGDIASALLVLVSIPLGLIGVVSSLWIFQSTVSLNSVLGVILLNGISVANSIILVDFMKRKIAEGIPPKAAALLAAQARVRPILMTSLTTILGMLPIAIGLGEGGKILQPLGIAVCGGLWCSLILSLLIVPTLQVAYLNWKNGAKP